MSKLPAADVEGLRVADGHAHVAVTSSAACANLLHDVALRIVAAKRSKGSPCNRLRKKRELEKMRSSCGASRT